MLLGRDLYRALLREAANLPDQNSRLFFKRRIQAGFRREAVPETSITAVKRTKQAERLLRQLTAANDGYLHALVRVLDHTYGRRGASKQAILRPIIKPTISADRQHPFSPLLTALVTSPTAHTSKSPSKATLLTPPLLPPRAFPDTEDTRLLGPLSSQRINKIRLRFRNEQIGKIRPPVAVEIKYTGDESKRVGVSELEQWGLDGVKLGSEALKELEKLARVPLEMRPRPPKRLQSDEERTHSSQGPTSTLAPKAQRTAPRISSPSPPTSKWTDPRHLTPRFLRRRYQDILQRSPILTALVEGSKENAAPPKVSFAVTRSPWATEGEGRLAVMSAEDMWWAEEPDKSSKPRRR